jgi:hypothetical protein
LHGAGLAKGLPSLIETEDVLIGQGRLHDLILGGNVPDVLALLVELVLHSLAGIAIRGVRIVRELFHRLVQISAITGGIKAGEEAGGVAVIRPQTGFYLFGRQFGDVFSFKQTTEHVGFFRFISRCLGALDRVCGQNGQGGAGLRLSRMGLRLRTIDKNEDGDEQDSESDEGKLNF